MKQPEKYLPGCIFRSHPSWVCGLKHVILWAQIINITSHPSWVCGLKLSRSKRTIIRTKVTPFVGVWIETIFIGGDDKTLRSHPSWVCGLKLQGNRRIDRTSRSHPSWVCGLKLTFIFLLVLVIWSHPSWVCGLKLATPKTQRHKARGHTLRGCVD